MTFAADYDAQLRARAERHRAELERLRADALRLLADGRELYAVDVVDELWPGPYRCDYRQRLYKRVKDLLVRLEDDGVLVGERRFALNGSGPGRRYFRLAKGKPVT